jgi:O-antigen ligase
VCWGFVAGVALLMVEMISGQRLHLWLYNIVPQFRPHASEYVARGGLVVSVRFEQINRSIATMTLLLWPVLGLMQLRLARRRGRFATLAFIPIAAVIVFASPHESSKLALLVSLGVAALAAWSCRAAFGLLLAGWLVLCLLCVPIAEAAFRARLYESARLQDSARARLILWGVSANRVADAPLLGIGAGAGRVLDDREAGKATTLPGQPFELRTGSHQHNVYLQTWYELGAAGALLLMMAGGLAMGRTRTINTPFQPYALAGIAAVVAMSAVSYGLWQAWFQAIIAWPLLVAFLWVYPPSKSQTSTES